MNSIQIETFDQFKQSFSQETFDKASKAFLEKNLLIPFKMSADCLYVITTKDSNLREMNDLKFVYSCIEVMNVPVGIEVFSEIYEFCDEQIDEKIPLNDSDETPELLLKPSDEIHSTIIWTESPPFLTIVFYILAALGLLGGLTLGVELWPGDPKVGYEWKTIAYTASITWIMAGIIECAIFTAIGRALFYMKGIYENSKLIANFEKDKNKKNCGKD